jgi:hypothetical protein
MNSLEGVEESKKMFFIKAYFIYLKIGKCGANKFKLIKPFSIARLKPLNF